MLTDVARDSCDHELTNCVVSLERRLSRLGSRTNVSGSTKRATVL